ncbi:hypothetical protein B4064_2396 [Caldibacillus thermoamylovorans]|nr:hypothetical protein B4064_2396 [Caldibacillus thermoamylovorans]KIO66657.1 hypothetical protein B4065_2201 [Caldibacillus thermoamylovorans]
MGHVRRLQIMKRKNMAFILSLFAAITVQKNVRDTQKARERE